MSFADRRKFIGTTPHSLRTWPRRYAFALLILLVVTFTRYILGVVLGFTQPFVLFYPTIMLIALLVGFWPGVLSTVFATLLATYLFLPPLNSFSISGTSDIVGLVLFLLMGVIISGLAELARLRAIRLREFERVVEGLQDMIVVMDREYRYIIANEAFLKYRGMKLEQVLSRTADEVIDSDVFKAVVKPKIDECFRGKVVRYEMKHKYPSMGERDLFVTYFPIAGYAGVDRVACVLRDVTEKKHAAAALRKSEDRYRDLVEHSEDLVCTHDLEGNLISANPAAARILGYEVSELIKIPMRELAAPEFRDKFDLYLETIRTTGSDTGLLCVVTRGGERRIWEYNNTLRTEGVTTPVVRGMARDVTEQKRAEAALRASEQRYRLLFEKNIAGVGISNMDGQVLDCNDAWAHILGYDSADAIRGRHASEFYVNPADREPMRQELEQQGILRGRETQLRRKDGTAVWILFDSVIRESHTGEPVIQVSAIDITKRKQAQEDLRRREEDYRRFVAQSSEGIFREDLDGPIPIDLPEDELIHRIMQDSYLAECNDAMAKMYGHSSAQGLMGKRLTETLAVDDPRNIELTREYIRSGFRVLERESHETDVHGNLKVFRNSMMGIIEDGKLVRTWGIQRDVTEQVKLEDARQEAEKALRKSEEHFRILVEQASDGIFLADAKGRYLTTNTAGAQMLGYTREEIVQLSITNIVAAEEVSRIAPEIARFESGDILQSEWKFRRKDGTTFPGEVCGKRLPDGRLQGIVRDITQRKLAEEALRASELEQFEIARRLEVESARLIEAQAVAKVGSWELELRGLEVTWSEQTHRIFETDPSQFHPRRPDFVEFVHPEDRARLDAAFSASLEEHAPRTIEYRIVLADGRVKVLEEHWKIFDDEQGRPIRLMGTCQDVTERKRAEEALRQSEERFRVALKDSPITVFSQDKDLRYTWIYNPRLYWRQDITGKTDEELIGAKQAASLTELKRRVVKTGKPVRDEVIIPHEGINYAFDMAIEPLFGRDKSIIGITGSSMDIARLRQLAESLQHDKEKLARDKSYLEKEIETELGFEEIVGHSSALRDVLSKARVVAPTDSTVLLLGETGTGKELVARSVHALSLRHERNFIKLNCAAVPSGLLESELFGHEKGAFTGAVSQKVGRIELADQGTFFLDEIGELPPELQPKLLRVLQDREFERLGGVRTLHVDVRIIAATNRDLHQDVAEKKFREDLFYRLNVFPIRLPALRDRRSDIPLLVHHFVGKYAAKMRKQIDKIPDESMDVLERWNWPGNVRELENVIERMVILTHGTVLAPPPAELNCPQEFFDDNLTEMEREHIIRILRETNGVLSGAEGAASRLGMKRTTLQSMLKRLGIEAHEYRGAAGMYGKNQA